MGLKDLLEKMKLVEFEAASAGPSEAGAPAPPALPARRPAGPAAPPPPRQSLEEIVKGATLAPAKVDAAALERSAASAGGTADVPDFPGIYKASGVTDPAHGFSAYKVLEMLQSPDFAALEPRAKAAALAGFLKFNPSGAVPIADVIEDAVKRDQALDAFEEFLRKKLEARRAALEQDNQRLQAEIDELSRKNREAMEQNRQALEGEKERFATWQARKRIEERKLHDAVAPFVEQNPVTLGGAAAPAAPAAGTSKPAAS